MTFDTPDCLRAEHEELRAQLKKAMEEPGAIGETALEVERLLHQHFVREEQYAMPPLGLLLKIAWGTVGADMAHILPLTRRLKAELPSMLVEHKNIIVAVKRLRAAAQQANHREYERFANALILHARTEENVLYPAAILVGEYVALKLEQNKATAK